MQIPISITENKKIIYFCFDPFSAIKMFDIMRTLYDLDNIIWEISNESHNRSKSWQYHMINYIREYEKRKPKQHLIYLSSFYPNGQNEALWQSSAELVSPNSEGGYMEDPPPNYGDKIVLLDTDHLWGIGGNYEWVWKSFLQGYNPIFMDPYKDLGDSSKWHVVRKNLGYTKKFADKINLATMMPQGELSSTGYCLASRHPLNSRYLVYFSAKRKGLVDLSGATGKLKSEWFDPLSGKAQRGEEIIGGRKITFHAPHSKGAVLHIFSNENSGVNE